MKDTIIADLKTLEKQLNRTPNRTEFINFSAISKRTVNKYFGTYTEALLAADIKPIKSLDKGISQVSCKHCDKSFQKNNKDIEKTNNNFCSRSCAATYNNLNRDGYNFDITRRRFFPRLTPNYIYLKSFVICENCNTTYHKIGTRISTYNSCSNFCRELIRASMTLFTNLLIPACATGFINSALIRFVI